MLPSVRALFRKKNRYINYYICVLLEEKNVLFQTYFPNYQNNNNFIVKKHIIIK